MMDRKGHILCGRAKHTHQGRSKKVPPVFAHKKMNCDRICDRLIAMCQKAERKSKFFTPQPPTRSRPTFEKIERVTLLIHPFILPFRRIRGSVTYLRRLEEPGRNARDKVIGGSPESQLHE